MACMKYVAFVFLAISGLSSDQMLLVQGRLQFGKFSNDFTESGRGEENAISKVRLLIGSRPPRCERRMCPSCGHCEAVQVPISPSTMRYVDHHSKDGIIFYAAPTSVNAYPRGDGISNYKPMCWKCKCGDFIVNP